MRGMTPAALVLALAPATVDAYCLLPGAPDTYAKFWGARFPDLRIPVYIAVGLDSSVLYTGLDEADVAAIVQRMISTHNEAVGAPVLYYAGTTEQELDPDGQMRARPTGIVVDSFSCAQALLTPPCTAAQLACTRPGGNSDDLLAKARITLQPSSWLCGDAGVLWGIEAGVGKDLSRVLLHELGHALGLGHTDDDPCAGASQPGGHGVMRRVQAGTSVYGRTWRRDDIAGLRAIYGDEIRHALYTWRDDEFPGAPDESTREAVCTVSRTPPTLTDGQGDALLLGFTDADDRVSLLAWDGGRFVAPEGGAAIDPSRHGVSFAPVGLAHGDGVVLAVWSADDAIDASENRLRWALRPLAGGAWNFGYIATPSGATQKSTRVAVGFDRRTQLFLVASVADEAEPYIAAIDPVGVQRATTLFGAAVFPALRAFDIGRPVCFMDGGTSRCTMPYTSGNYDGVSTFDLLHPGWFSLEVAPAGGVTLIDAHRSALFAAPGLVDLAGGPAELRGVVADQRHTLAAGDFVPVLESEHLGGEDWPLRIGSDETGVRVAARRLAGACGDGMVECAEECDDGNRSDGDGCSAQCTVEAPEATTGASPTSSGVEESSGGDPGMPEVHGSDGCGCVSDRPPSLLWGLLALRRRRRSRRSMHLHPAPAP